MRNLIPYFIQEQYLQGNLQGSFEAYTMYIDLSGFTPLTETLMEQGPPGAEQLSVILNNIFGLMVRVVYEYDGFVPYFAGDAITAIFPVEDSEVEPLDLLYAAQKLQNDFADKNRQKEAFGSFEIGVKIRLSFGEVQWGIVGNQLKSYYFRGSAIDRPTLPNVVSKETGTLFDTYFGARIPKNAWPEVDTIKKNFFRVKTPLQVRKKNPEVSPIPPLQPDVLAEFLPPSVLDFNQEGEFREVLSLFLTFKGIKTHQQINQFASIILRLVDNFSGYFKEIDFGDKGGMMVIFFGAPVSFENNIDRALELITALFNDTRRLQSKNGLQIRAGISIGLSYTGIVGGEERCQYAVVGNLVNLAARLMTQADWGSVRVDETVARSKNFRFNLIGDTQYKGIAERIPTYELAGRTQEEKTGYSSKMVGREKELSDIIEFAKPIFSGDFAGLVSLYGEAGIGKSRLAFEVKKALLGLGNVNWLNCPADQILRKPFNPFVAFLKDYFLQSPDSSSADNKAAFEGQYNNLLLRLQRLNLEDAKILEKELERTQSILAALVAISYPNSLWSQLDARGRYQNTLEALSALFIAESLIQPVVIELEDGHWFDRSSKNFLKTLITRIRKYPIFILITSRYSDDGNKPHLIEPELLKENRIEELQIDLNIFSDESLRQFVETKLNGIASQELLDLLHRSTNGNPFYLEQTLDYFLESQLLKKGKNGWMIEDTNVPISNSLSSVLMARIDRLSTLVKETVKAAAVIGREFEVPVLTEIMKANKEFSKYPDNPQTVLQEQVQSAEKFQIWLAINELRYIFRHSLLREAVYNMQMGTRLRELHLQIGNAIEHLYADNLKEKYVDLAFHYELAREKTKAVEFLEKAANQARGDFQNDQALDLYNRLLPLVKEEEQRCELLLQKAKVLELTGKWDACVKDLKTALKLAGKIKNPLLLGRSKNRLGRINMLRGNYPEAQKYFEKAQKVFTEIDDSIGISKVTGNLGNLFFRQGNYPKANRFFYQSLEYSRSQQSTLSHANIVSHLGLAYMNQGQFEEGIKVQLEELSNCKARNDKQGMATLYTNLGIVYFEKGDYDKALESYQKGLIYAQELGNKQLTSIAIGCIGSVHQQQGDYANALENFLTDLKICEEIGDKQGIAIALGLLGELRAVEGEFDLAKEYLQEAIQLCEELGYQKGIAKAANNLGDIYMFLKKYDQALQYYNKAIEIARNISNQLVLGFSLVEKSEVYVAMGQHKKALTIQDEANEIAQTLGNPDLLFQALLLKARLTGHFQSAEEAKDQLFELIKNDSSETQRAAVFYELFLLYPDDPNYRKTALELYKKRYKETPKFSFRERIKVLEKAKR